MLSHKILTGRQNKMSEFCQTDSILGFCKRKESIYDYFGAGYSSTSISAAQGLSLSKSTLNKIRNNCITVIGDCVITG